MSDLLTAFFSLNGMLIFFLGAASACAWHVVRMRVIGQPQRVNWSVLGIIMGISAMVFVGMQNTQLAAEVQTCQRQFNASLKARADISEDNDRLSREHRHWLGKTAEAVGDLISWSVNPTNADIAKLDMQDPRRQAYNSGLVAQYEIRTQRYRAIMDTIEAQQDDNQRERAAHPLPEPTCGKG